MESRRLDLGTLPWGHGCSGALLGRESLPTSGSEHDTASCKVEAARQVIVDGGLILPG